MRKKITIFRLLLAAASLYSMNKHRHLLADLWEDYQELLTNRPQSTNLHDISRYMMDMVAQGPYYHYLINIRDYSLTQISSSILDIHGLDRYPSNVQDVIDLIHPDDQAYVLEAERKTIEIMQTKEPDKLLHFKTSYCFRMRVADGSYHLFHHQAIHLTTDEAGKLTSALNIHTDVQHITQTNAKIVLVSSIEDRHIRYQIDLSESVIPKKSHRLTLSKREQQILHLLTQGLSSEQVAAALFISTETVRVHRRNMLRKTETNNLRGLIGHCIEEGLL